MKKTIKNLISQVDKYKIFLPYEDLIIHFFDNLFDSCTVDHRGVVSTKILIGEIGLSYENPDNLEIVKDFLEELANKNILTPCQSAYIPNCFKRIPYCEYKNTYSNCEAVRGSYDKKNKTIEVLIPINRPKEFIYFNKQHTDDHFLKIEFMKLIKQYHPDLEGKGNDETIDHIKAEFLALSSSQDESKRFIAYLNKAKKYQYKNRI